MMLHIAAVVAAVMTGALQIVASPENSGGTKTRCEINENHYDTDLHGTAGPMSAGHSDAGPRIYCLRVATFVWPVCRCKSGNIFMSPTRKCCCCNIAIADPSTCRWSRSGSRSGSLGSGIWPKGFGTGTGGPACGKCEYSGDRLINNESNSHRS